MMRFLDTHKTGDTSARGGRQARAETSGGGTTSATCVATRSSPTGIWRGSDDPDSHKWVPNVGTGSYVARIVSPTHAADPHLPCLRSLMAAKTRRRLAAAPVRVPPVSPRVLWRGAASEVACGGGQQQM